MVREWREHARQAKEAGEGHTGFLLALASRELEQRQANQVQRPAARGPVPTVENAGNYGPEQVAGTGCGPGSRLCRVRLYHPARERRAVGQARHGQNPCRHGVGRGGLPQRLPRGVHHGSRALVNTLIESREERQLKRLPGQAVPLRTAHRRRGRLYPVLGGGRPSCCFRSSRTGMRPVR